MSVIKHKDIEIYYESHPLLPHTKVFKQDLHQISPNVDAGIELIPEGLALENLKRLGYDHPNYAYSKHKFNELPPTFLPSYNYIFCKSQKRKFWFPDIMQDLGIIAPNQLLVSYRFMGLLQKFRMAPHITIPAVIKFRDTYIDDYYLVLYFYQHGCDHVLWERTVFGYTKGFVDWQVLNTFNLNSLEEYKELLANPPEKTYKLLSVAFNSRYDIFYSIIGLGIYVTPTLEKEINSNKLKDVAFTFRQFETIVIN